MMYLLYSLYRSALLRYRKVHRRYINGTASKYSKAACQAVRYFRYSGYGCFFVITLFQASLMFHLLYMGYIYFFGDSGDSGDRCGMMRFVVSDLSPVLSPDYCKWAVQKNTMMKVFAAAVTTVSTNYNKGMDFLFSLKVHKSDSDENTGF